MERAYVWLDGEPYAMVSSTTDAPISYFHNDRMGTPQRLTNEAGKTVWRAEFRPFGDFETVDTDPDKDGVAVENNLRFAGQYDEGLLSVLSALGRFYNWNRSYEPSTGRYLQPEPVLQNAGLVLGDSISGRGTSAYSYAYNNPLHYVDPTGLQAMDSATAGCLAGSPSACAALGYESAAALKAALELAGAAGAGAAAGEAARRGYLCQWFGIRCPKTCDAAQPDAIPNVVIRVCKLHWGDGNYCQYICGVNNIVKFGRGVNGKCPGIRREDELTN